MYFAHGTRNDHYILTLVYFSISNHMYDYKMFIINYCCYFAAVVYLKKC